MYVSSLRVETGSDPNRLRPGRRWIRNAYHVHQRLLMAFDGADEPRVLFRLEGPIASSKGLRPRILVQSITEPQWDAAFCNAPFLLCDRPQVKRYEPQFSAGDKLRFLLRANPSKKERRQGPNWLIKNNPRRGITLPDEQLAWLERKAQRAGFRRLQAEIVSRGKQYSSRSKVLDPHRHIHLAVTFRGLLEVIDPEAFLDALKGGIGPGKAYGFGLLSVARS